MNKDFAAFALPRATVWSRSNPRCPMKSSFEQALIEVRRQALVENSKVVKLGSQGYSLRRTPKRGLRQVDFVFDGFLFMFLAIALSTPAQTAHDYFNELKAANTFNHYKDEYVCFRDDDVPTFAIIAKGSDVIDITLVQIRIWYFEAKKRLSI